MITVSTSPEAYHHGNLRDALLAAGLAALEGAAGKAPSLRELARVVGVSATAVYRHFPTSRHSMPRLPAQGWTCWARNRPLPPNVREVDRKDLPKRAAPTSALRSPTLPCSG